MLLRAIIKNTSDNELEKYTDEINKLLIKFSLTDVVEIVHKLSGINKNKVYKWILNIKRLSKSFFSFLVFIIILNYGCSPVGVVASGGATTMVVAEGDQVSWTVVDDATIKVNIAAKFLNCRKQFICRD